MALNFTADIADPEPVDERYPRGMESSGHLLAHLHTSPSSDERPLRRMLTSCASGVMLQVAPLRPCDQMNHHGRTVIDDRPQLLLRGMA